jgi:hypothetical protein
MALRATTKVLACAFVTTAAAAIGCQPKQDDADRFRQAVPQADEVALKVPGAGSTSSTTTKDVRLSGGPTPTTTSDAEYYRFTRDLTNGVDWGTGIILGAVWLVVNTPPTTIDTNHAVWGPGNGNALDPVTWRFSVTEVGDHEYDYVLEGQRKGSSDFVTVLNGHGYGEERPEHKTGWFLANNDAFHTLDPDNAHDTGTTKVTFDLRALPATIDVELKHPADGSFANVDVTHEAGGAGAVVVSAHADIDPTKGSKLEDIALTSRWLTDGSGRADVEIKGGDMPLTVDASECWSPTFARVYYKDTVNYEAATGSESACSLTAAKPGA